MSEKDGKNKGVNSEWRIAFRQVVSKNKPLILLVVLLVIALIIALVLYLIFR